MHSALITPAPTSSPSRSVLADTASVGRPSALAMLPDVERRVSGDLLVESSWSRFSSTDKILLLRRRFFKLCFDHCPVQQRIR